MRQSYAALLGLARRYARRSGEAEDLLQSALVVALEAGRTDVMAAENRRWFHGVLKRLSAFEARSAMRRRSRETAWHGFGDPTFGANGPETGDEFRAFALELPPRLRTAALLMLGGHTRAEVAWLLRVSDMAVRQYVSEIRKRWRRRGGREPGDFVHLAGSLAFGRIRQNLRPHVLRHAGTLLASHDPDGHGFVIRLSSQDAR
jgi:RNA polymerase sigma-70 factor (ECF subfamily)